MSKSRGGGGLPFQEITARLSADELVKRLKVTLLQFVWKWQQLIYATTQFSAYKHQINFKNKTVFKEGSTYKLFLKSVRMGTVDTTIYMILEYFVSN